MVKNTKERIKNNFLGQICLGKLLNLTRHAKGVSFGSQKIGDRAPITPIVHPELLFEIVIYVIGPIQPPSGRGHEPDPEKIAVINNLSVSKTKELRRVLALYNYYREYVPRYSELVYPLTELTTKRISDSLLWTEKHNSSFHLLKKASVEAPSLYSAVPDKPYTIHSDASQIGIVACLSQKCDDKCYPIAYESQKLSKTQKSHG
ncbi:retrovirus-related Pol polyprotein from transposon 17.6 [Trichonephila clavata]|uniref:Retrovirus-related Pol polyprotein from transposon 17.6 n=1 Tax=Trichonephila clavata TaxID=2740835 RepID=A0A8X6L2R2_TRICU|nr:retrovirus-related Pol polyprotein from transposon 17.6 [Trichonephila clavata]